MASTDATAIPVKNQAYRITFPILDADGDLVTGATGLDSEVSKDAGTFADATAEATEIATSSGMYYLDLTATEMNADTVAIIVKTTSSGAKTVPIVLYPQEAGDINVDVTYWNGTAVATPATAGVPSVDVVYVSGDATAADNLETAFDDTAGAVPWFGIVDQGTAQSASSTGVVLRAAAAFADDVLIGSTLAVYGSTQGYWQTRVITDNALTGDSVVVDTWTVTPSGTITYKIYGTPPASATSLPAVNLVQVAGATTDVSALATNVAAILVDTGTTLDTKINTIDDFLDTEVAAVLAAVDTEVAAILADTNELQTDWANGGRLDLILDARASQASVDAVDDLLDTEVAAIKTVVDSILVDTAEIGAAGAGLTALATQASVTAIDDLVDTEVAAIKTVVDAVQVKTDQLTFTVANKIDANILNINSQGIGATKPYDTAT
jgi:hypothetical protein